MKKFLKFDERTIKSYVIENGLFETQDDFTCMEIGDGNLNYIFKIKDKLSTKSFIIKQADDFARISRDLIVSRSRNTYEAAAIQYTDTICTGYVPKIHKVDKTLSCFVMEDLGNNSNLKDLFVNHQIIDVVAHDIADYLSKQYYYSSCFYLQKTDQKRFAHTFNNPEMCKITAKLVFEYPYIYNEVLKTYKGKNIDYVDRRIVNNQALLKKVHEYKKSFLEKKQSFVHGDLHTGSLCYFNNQIKILDYEFAFYGPIGYDLGNILAHCIFAIIHAGAKSTCDPNAISFAKWLISTITLLFELFFEYTHQKIKDDFIFEEFHKEVIVDINAFCATEIIRRILGIAKSKELVDIDKSKITEIEKQLLDFCVEIILHDDTFGLAEYVGFLNEYIKTCN